MFFGLPIGTCRASNPAQCPEWTGANDTCVKMCIAIFAKLTKFGEIDPLNPSSLIAAIEYKVVCDVDDDVAAARTSDNVARKRK